ncbi:hypothetical protein DFP73DRAFT_623281 [Morchella snyderi]|nr:hypothetical protein DFP73DRAFT_623281 [Morchella snyderi]
MLPLLGGSCLHVFVNFKKGQGTLTPNTCVARMSTLFDAPLLRMYVVFSLICCMMYLQVLELLRSFSCLTYASLSSSLSETLGGYLVPVGEGRVENLSWVFCSSLTGTSTILAAFETTLQPHIYFLEYKRYTTGCTPQFKGQRNSPRIRPVLADLHCRYKFLNMGGTYHT